MVVLLAHYERAVRNEHDVNRSIELGRRTSAILKAFRPIASDCGDFTCRVDGPNAMIVAVGNVDDSVRTHDQSGRIVESGVGPPAVREPALPVARDRRDSSI